jgi:hypothetical protein
VDLDILFGNPIFSGRPLGPRGRARASRCQTAAEYTVRWGWTIALVDDAGACDELPPGTGAAEVRSAWQRHPGAELRLLTGGCFDVLDVPERAGYAALVRLERMAIRPGPVLATAAGRALFLVAPDAAASLPDLLYKTGWDDAELDLTCHGAGSSVPAPPTPLSRWLRPPTPETSPRPPEARLLLGALAYACRRGVAELVGRR